MKQFHSFLFFSFLLILAVSSCSAPDNFAVKRYDRSLLGPSETEQSTGIPLKSCDEATRALFMETEKWLGTPYRFGGSGENGIDCSALACILFKKVFDIRLERNSRSMAEKNTRELKKKDLVAGDLVFFSTARKRKLIDHVGVYLGNGAFVHASSKGVRIDNLGEKYYKSIWVKGGRVIY